MANWTKKLSKVANGDLEAGEQVVVSVEREGVEVGALATPAAND